MKRVIVTAFIVASFFLALHRPASALAEFCPATLNYARVGPDSAKDEPGDLFGFNLSALGTRTITSATLAFDTSAGWYTLDVPAATLSVKERHYTSPWVAFVRHDYVSPNFYARFSQNVKINHAWVYSASAQNDAAFGWQAQGTVLCDPPPAASPAQARGLIPAHDRQIYTLDPKDDDHLSSPPSRMSMILAATPSKPLETEDCAVPFRDATVKEQVTPAFPESMYEQPVGKSTTSVEVAIKPDGGLMDAWVWGPSGVTMFDDAGLRAARMSAYEGARSYCRDVPGRYFFRVTFEPNR